MDPHDLKHRLHEAFKSTVELVTAPRSTSAFKERGLLTPEEFVEAGDQLVQCCPTWSWESGELSRRKSYLPADKQYLITRNVPCIQRAASFESFCGVSGSNSGGEGEEEVRVGVGEGHEADGGEEEEEAWIATHVSRGPRAGVSAQESEGHVTSSSKEASKAAAATAAAGVEANGGSSDGGSDRRKQELRREEEEDEDDGVPDMASFGESSSTVEADEATLETGYLVAVEPDESNILRTRTYDLTITYDKYYQTPRVWLFGYDELRRALSQDEIFQDVSQDHIKRTVTIDDHPNLPGKFASVHPCKHGAVMKKIVQQLDSNGVEPRVDQYLFIFLKFISSIIPTIEYDYTMEADLGGQS